MGVHLWVARDNQKNLASIYVGHLLSENGVRNFNIYTRIVQIFIYLRDVVRLITKQGKVDLLFRRRKIWKDESVRDIVFRNLF